ncbi:MAG: hypothetical protein QOF66_4038 [Mycobacterium sp.]|jgi:hypothetical protein|nr:hypothetical protein [Mycobacterium sp.]
MEPPPPPGPPLPVGPPGTEPSPLPGPPLPVGPPGTEPPPEVSPGADDVGAGVVLVVELVVVVVVVLLLVEPPLPPPHPTASASIATPPSSATVTLGSDFISYPLSPRRATNTPGAVARNSRTVRGTLTARTQAVQRTGRRRVQRVRICRRGSSATRISDADEAQAVLDVPDLDPTRGPQLMPNRCAEWGSTGGKLAVQQMQACIEQPCARRRGVGKLIGRTRHWPAPVTIISGIAASEASRMMTR